MIDTFKLNLIKGFGIAIGVLLIFIIGFGIGQIGKKPKTTEKAKVQKVAKGSELTQDYIQEFLIAYYTKKDLEENRSRYKPFMTEGLYNAVTNMEDQPVNQTYKGYVVDQVFKDAKIYIDAKNNMAIVSVNYTNTLLKNKNDYKDAQKDVASQNTLRLTFTKDGKTFKVNNMSYLLVTDSTNVTDNANSYGSLQEESPEDSTSQSGSLDDAE